MGRGRKPISSFHGSDWETVFYNSVGSYVQFINIELSKEYKLEPLSSHIKIIGGYAFKTAQYKKQGVPIIRISDFNNEQIILKDVVYYESAPNLEKFELVEGDIIIALTGGTIAKLAIVQPDLGKIYLNQRVGKFEVLHPEIFETEYIYWIARSVQSIIKNLAWGAAIPNVSPKQIEELRFPFPTKEVQKGIIAFLNDLKNNTVDEDRIYFNEHIENEIILLQEKQITTSLIATELNNQLDIIKQLRKSFLSEAMRGELIDYSDINNNDFDTGQQLLERIRLERDQLIKDKKLKKEKELLPITEIEIPFEIPNNWAWCRLGETGNLKRGKSKHRPRNDISLFIDGSIPFIQTGDVSKAKYNKDLITTVNGYYNDFGLKQSELQKKGTLCITIAANIAECGFLDFDACVPDSIVCFLSINKYIEKYVYYFILTAKEELERYAPATAQKNINLGILNDLKIPFPPIHIQKKIVKKLEKLMIELEELEFSIKKSQIINEKILQQTLREALGLKLVEQVDEIKDTKRIIKKFYTNGNDTFTTLSMKIVEILKTASEPLPANVVWNSSEFSDDIELFYAELKKLIDIEKVVVEEKIGMESYLKLA